MNPPDDVAERVTEELLLVRQKVQSSLAGGGHAFEDAQDAYVSALIGHLFATLLTPFGPGLVGVDHSPEGLARALNVISRKVGAVADNLDPASDYRIQIFRRDRNAPA